MWDNWLESIGAPIVQCSKCNKKIVLKGDYAPKEIYCLNCGNELNLVFGKDHKFRNVKFDENGEWIRENKESENA